LKIVSIRSNSIILCYFTQYRKKTYKERLIRNAIKPYIHVVISHQRCSNKTGRSSSFSAGFFILQILRDVPVSKNVILQKRIFPGTLLS
jgi:hypothetical protein